MTHSKLLIVPKWQDTHVHVHSEEFINEILLLIQTFLSDHLYTMTTC